jgi:ribosomal-protein-alanine N-acetyltransferase
MIQQAVVVADVVEQPSELRTERIVLRRYVPADFAAIHAYAGDPEVTRYSTWGPNDEAASRKFLEYALASQSVADGRYSFAIARPVSDELIGGCSVELVDTHHGRAELGYVVAREWWGQGLATEAAGLLKSFAFDSLGVHRLQATCHPDNIGSMRVLEKTGFTFEGRLRDHMLMRGQWRDSLLYAVVNAADAGPPRCR